MTTLCYGSDHQMSWEFLLTFFLLMTREIHSMIYISHISFGIFANVTFINLCKSSFNCSISFDIYLKRKQWFVVLACSSLESVKSISKLFRITYTTVNVNIIISQSSLIIECINSFPLKTCFNTNYSQAVAPSITLAGFLLTLSDGVRLGVLNSLTPDCTNADRFLLQPPLRLLPLPGVVASSCNPATGRQVLRDDLRRGDLGVTGSC